MFHDKKLILFDFDGTLADSVGVWNAVDQELIQRLGGDWTDPLEIQNQRDDLLRWFSMKPDPYRAYCAELAIRCHSDMEADAIVELRYAIAQDYLRQRVDYKPQAETIIKKLKEKEYILLIATTTRKKNMDIYRHKNQNIRQKAPLDTYFTKIYTREDAERIKPDPQIYERILTEWKVQPSQCLIFEDSLIGVEAANRAGIEVIAMHDAYSDHEREEIKKRADWYFDTYAEVIACFEQECA